MTFDKETIREIKHLNIYLKKYPLGYTVYNKDNKRLYKALTKKDYL